MSFINEAKKYIDKICQKIASINTTITKKTIEEKNLKAKLEILKNENEVLEAIIDEVKLHNKTWAEKNELLYEKEQEIANIMEAISAENSKFKINKELLDNLIK